MCARLKNRLLSWAFMKLEIYFSFLPGQDSPSGIKAGVAAGMPVVGLATRNPAHLLMEAGAAFLIKDYDDKKLWTALEELDLGATQVSA